MSQPLEDFPHLESLYGGARALPATSVEIAYRQLLRLDLSLYETPAGL